MLGPGSDPSSGVEHFNCIANPRMGLGWKLLLQEGSQARQRMPTDSINARHMKTLQ
jgi:hypothetical protein